LRIAAPLSPVAPRPSARNPTVPEISPSPEREKTSDTAKTMIARIAGEYTVEGVGGEAKIKATKESVVI